jgi:hypothetical protein
MAILAIDPGTDQSGYVVVLDDGSVAEAGVIPNGEMKKLVYSVSAAETGWTMAIEMISSFGMPVGREVFETCVFIGMLLEAWDHEKVKVYRREVKLHLCGTCRAKDPNVRQALIDEYGGSSAIGNKKNPGPLYRVKSHAWAALGVADYVRRAAVED